MKQDVSFEKFKNTVLIYGAHLVAISAMRYLKQKRPDVMILGFAVTSIKDNPQELDGLLVKEISEWPKEANPKDVTAVIAMPKKYHEEVKKTLLEYGYTDVVCLDLYELSALIGEERIKKMRSLGFDVRKSENDISWLDLYIDDIHLKFPTLFYIGDEEIYENLDRARIKSSYESFISSKGVLEKNRCGSRTGFDDGKIFMACSEWDEKAGSGDFAPWIKPLQLGAALSERTVADITDDCGENISALNRSFAEMTGAYWIWKNENSLKYKGLCHYRRHFVFEAEDDFCCGEADVILTTPRYVPGGVEEMFLVETPVKKPVMEALKKSTAKLYGEDVKKKLEKYLKENFYCPNNMAVAKNEIYNSYCKFVFPILFEMKKQDEKAVYGHEGDRHIAYAAELLTSFYFYFHKDEFKTVFRDYKMLQ
ncbi:MAG: DUF4422 domain-containing protein [Eubacterium sp.]|nr:DUF4422 domain-containing protein [Eubacterium sp.]